MKSASLCMSFTQLRVGIADLLCISLSCRQTGGQALVRGSPRSLNIYSPPGVKVARQAGRDPARTHNTRLHLHVQTLGSSTRKQSRTLTPCEQDEGSLEVPAGPLPPSQLRLRPQRHQPLRRTAEPPGSLLR